MSVPKEVLCAIDQARDHCLANSGRGYLGYAGEYLINIPHVLEKHGEAGLKDQLLYILSNLQAWKGEEARRVKKILKTYAEGDPKNCTCAGDMASDSKLDEDGHLPDCRSR